MKVLLINSPYIFPDPHVRRLEPLGLEYLTSYLKFKGHDVTLWDSTLSDPNEVSANAYYYGPAVDEVVQRVKEIKPEVVGISCHYTYAKQQAYDMATLIKSIDPAIIVVLGGLFVSIYQDLALKECEDIDYCLVGESEHTFSILLNKLTDSRYHYVVEGLIWRAGSETVISPKNDYIKNLSIPFPFRDYPEIEVYKKGCFHKSLYGLGFKPALSLLTSRSCPNRCTFCNMRLVHGNTWRDREIDDILAEIEELIYKHKIEHLFILDDNFTLRPGRTKQLLEEIIRRKYKIRWNTPNGISAKNIDLELAKLMKKSGCANVCVAIETGSEYIRNECMNKKLWNEQIVQTIQNLNTVDIPVTGFVMVGMPEETEEHFEETKNFLAKLKLTSITVSHMIPFEGTDLHASMIRSGIIGKDFVLQNDYFNVPQFETRNFTKEDIIRRKKILTDMFQPLSVLEKIEKGEKGNKSD